MSNFFRRANGATFVTLNILIIRQPTFMSVNFIWSPAQGVITSFRYLFSVLVEKPLKIWTQRSPLYPEVQKTELSLLNCEALICRIVGY